MAVQRRIQERGGKPAALLEQRDDYGLALPLILATILVLALADGAVGQFVSVALSGFTFLFVLHTSDAQPRTFRAASVVVIVAVAAAAAALFVGWDRGQAAAGIIGLLLAVVAPIVILRRILSSPTITVHLVLGALAIYLLLGLIYAYLYPVISNLGGTPFFVQTDDPGQIDYVYFSYVTLTTVGFGDFTAASDTGRMISVSEALVGQLYLVSAVALLVGNIGRAIVRGTPETGVEIEPMDTVGRTDAADAPTSTD